VHRAQGARHRLALFASWFTCMGGTVLAHSEGEGRGSEFIVRSRLSHPRHASRRRRRGAREAPSGVRGRRILRPMTTGMRSIASATLLECDGHEVFTSR